MSLPRHLIFGPPISYLQPTLKSATFPMSSCFPGQVNLISKVEAVKSINPTVRSDTAGCIMYIDSSIFRGWHLLMGDTGYPGWFQLWEEHLWGLRPITCCCQSSPICSWLTWFKTFLLLTWARTKEPVARKSLSGPTAELPQQGGVSLFLIRGNNGKVYISLHASRIVLFCPWWTFVSFVPRTSQLKPYLFGVCRRFQAFFVSKSWSCTWLATKSMKYLA